MKWEIYGVVNDGYDGMPNNQGELTNAEYYSGCGFRSPINYWDLISYYLDSRGCVLYSVERKEDYTNLNGDKYRTYEATISPKGKYMRVKRVFHVKRMKG